MYLAKCHNTRSLLVFSPQQSRNMLQAEHSPTLPERKRERTTNGTDHAAASLQERATKVRLFHSSLCPRAVHRGARPRTQPHPHSLASHTMPRQRCAALCGRIEMLG